MAMLQITEPGASIFTASCGRIRLTLETISVGNDLLVLLTGGEAHIGAIALATPEGIACSPECQGHCEGALACEIALELAGDLRCRVAVACGIHYDDITRAEIGETLKLARKLAQMPLKKANSGDMRMLSLADLHQFDEYMKSGELEQAFRQGPEEKRLELLELLEALMNTADTADEVATRLIFRGAPTGRIPPS